MEWNRTEITEQNGIEQNGIEQNKLEWNEQDGIGWNTTQSLK